MTYQETDKEIACLVEELNATQEKIILLRNQSSTI